MLSPNSIGRGVKVARAPCPLGDLCTCDANDIPIGTPGTIAEWKPAGVEYLIRVHFVRDTAGLMSWWVHAHALEELPFFPDMIYLEGV